MSDTFKNMWEDQEAFMALLADNRLFPAFPVDLSTKTGQQDVVHVFQHAMDELFEAKSELKNAKRHRQTEVDEFDKSRFIEELVDTQKLLLELLIMTDVRFDEFVDTYFKKSETNEQRVREKY